MEKYILEMKSITKEFPGVKALSDVTFNVERGEIHAICGENGAGKSTLMKILSGVYPHGSYSGEILYEGQPCAFREIKDSEAKGIVIIHQELAMIPFLDVAENMFLGNEQGSTYKIDWEKTHSRAAEQMALVGLHESPHTLIKDLGVGKQQLVEIAKALAKNVKLLILDEPTSSLNESESKKLLDLLLEFKKQGMTSILISHKLNEISYVADRITILRDGQTIETLDNLHHEIDEDRIIRGMVGRSLSNRFPDRPEMKLGEVTFEVKNWTVHHPMQTSRKICKDINLKVRSGEIIGIAGLMGAGRTELAMSLFGKSYGSKISGEVYIHGKKVNLHNVHAAIDHGLAYVTEDRKGNGLILTQPISFNTSMAKLKKISNRGRLDHYQERKVAADYVSKLRTKCSSIDQIVGNLSGGNQQKVLLSKWMFTDPDILILDEPTRGIDVGAKYEIYQIIYDLIASGKSVIMISSELPEVLGMCDRIYIMSEGEMRGELSRQEATQEKIMSFIVRGDKANSKGKTEPVAESQDAQPIRNFQKQTVTSNKKED